MNDSKNTKGHDGTLARNSAIGVKISANTAIYVEE